MVAKITKYASVLAILLTHILFSSGIALALPVTIDSKTTVIIAQTVNSSSEIIHTPQMRQRLQAIRQRRNRDIEKVLDSSQIAQLHHNLRSGDSFAQALEKLKLEGDQKELVEAIAKINDLKIKATLSRYSLQAAHK